MAKANSPVRLQDGLMQAAKLTGERFHRNSAEQVKVESLYRQRINPDEVFQILELQREEGLLTQQVMTSSMKYQISLMHSGCLEQIDSQGSIVVGQFTEGEFVAISEPVLE